MNELMTRGFENEEVGRVRMVVENGAVLFCGLDVSRALKYARPVSSHSLKQGAGGQTSVRADGTPLCRWLK